MTDVDPYVAPAAEPRPRARLAGWRPSLVMAIVVLLLAGWWIVQLTSDREDPTLQVPASAPEHPPVPTQVPTVPQE